MAKVYLAQKAELSNHVNDGGVHVTQAEKTKISNALTADNVVPETGADLTKLIATVGGKQIFAPEGGGGGGGGGHRVVLFIHADRNGAGSRLKLDNFPILKSEQVGSYVSIFVGDVLFYSFTDQLPKQMLLVIDGVSKIESFESYDGASIVTFSGSSSPSFYSATNKPITEDCILNVKFTSCLLDSTEIAMADGTVRLIRDIRVGDMVLSVDPDTGAFGPDRVVECDGDAGKRHGVKDVWRFDDGSEIETVHRHRVYNVDLGEPMYMEAWEMGERCRRADGSSPRLVSHERVNGDWTHCTLFTEKWNNYFANGILCGNRRSAKLKIGG